MRTTSAPLLCTLILFLLAPPARAAEEITGRDGRSAMVEVLETTDDSVTVEYRGGETVVKARVSAKQLEPYSFYGIRRGHMEDTAPNHLALARFCFENGLLALAKKHIDLAIATDPEFVEQRRAQVPDLVKKFSEALLADAKAYVGKGDFESAQTALSILLELFPETPPAAEGRELLVTMEETKEKHEADAHAAKMEKLSDDAAKKSAEERARALEPVVKARDLGRKMVHEGLLKESQSQAKSLFDQAIGQFKETRQAIENVVKLNAGKVELLADAEELRATVIVDSIHAICLAGGVSLSRSAFSEAEEYGRRALALDGESAEAQGFMARVQNAIANKDDIDVRTRRPRVGGGRR
jgi:tetratricopeptide (TPR) repeat protein